MLVRIRTASYAKDVDKETYRIYVDGKQFAHSLNALQFELGMECLFW